jgi:hypothetical protein
MGNFAILLPVSSHIVTLKLFPTQNISRMVSIAKVLTKLCLLNLKFYFHPIDRAKSCNFDSIVLYQCLPAKLLDTFNKFMYSRNEQEALRGHIEHLIESYWLIFPI